MAIIKLFLLLVVLSAIGSFARHRHTCVHDEISKEEPIHIQERPDWSDEGRSLQEGSVRNLKFHVDTTYLTGLTPEQRAHIVDKVIPVSFDFLSKRIRVPSTGRNLTVSNKLCRKLEIPESYKTQGVDADLVIFVTATNEPEAGFMAWAASCIKDKVNGRPIVGQINYNIEHLSLSEDEFENQVDVSMHEITHVLAFSSGLYDDYRAGFNSTQVLGKENVVKMAQVRGELRAVIASQKVREIGRAHFGCDSLVGVELENKGEIGAIGSHWERVILNNEYMSATEITDATVSNFTLALLHDSGWYQVDFSLAEPIFFGENAGCSFLENGCTNSSRREFCSPQQKRPLCSFNYKHKGYCSSDSMSDNCSYPRPFSGSNCENSKHGNNNGSRGETYGLGSKCVIGNVISRRFKVGSNISMCYKYRCEGNRIIFTTNNAEDIICDTPGAFVNATSTVYRGGLVCPDPQEYCRDYYPDCPNSCSGKGYCFRGVCECRAGFTGDDCSESS